MTMQHTFIFLEGADDEDLGQNLDIGCLSAAEATPPFNLLIQNNDPIVSTGCPGITQISPNPSRHLSVDLNSALRNRNGNAISLLDNRLLDVQMLSINEVRALPDITEGYKLNSVSYSKYSL